MSSEHPRITAIIPTFNEAHKIATAIEEVSKALGSVGETNEIIIVDNASPDHTASIAREICPPGTKVRVLVNSRNEGKGFSVRRGMLEANGDWRFFIDADLSTPPDEIPRFWKLAREEEFGIIVGSRLASGASVVRPQSLPRRLAGQVCLSVTRAIVPKLPRDIFCGFKWFRSDVAEILFSSQTTKGWLFDAEILGKAAMLGITVLEVPIHWENDPDSKLSMLKDLPSILKELLQIRKSIRSASRV
ncbi:MAG: hypothetical protein C4318_06160 [Acidimicrobiia bacterium]